MYAMSIFSSKNKSSLSLVFDLRDSYVSIAAINFVNESKPEIILCQNFEINPSNHEDYGKYTSSMLSSVKEGILAVRKDLAKKGSKESIRKYHFFIGSPWSVSESKTIKIIKNKKFEVTKEILGKIVSDEEETIKKDMSTSIKLENWKILEEKIVEFKLNGYKAEKVFDKKITELEAELFVSFIPVEVYKGLSDITSGGHIKTTMNSSMLASYIFFRDLYSDKNNFICVDIGNFVTDIFFVRNDVISGAVSFPLGEKDLIKTMMSHAKIPESSIMTYINMMCHGACEEETKKETKRLLKESKNIWLEKFKLAMSKISSETDIPKNIFVIENTNLVRAMMKELSDEDVNIMGMKMAVEHISEAMIDNNIENGKDFKNEPYIKIDTVFLDKIIFKK